MKGIDGAFELAGGLLLLFLTPKAINSIVLFFIRGELIEDPADLLANLVLRTSQSVVQGRSHASTFLIVHGFVKLTLVAGLAFNQLWSYPVGIAVFTGFTVYQLWELAHHYSLFLVIATVLDVLVIALVIAEYRHVKTEKTP